MAGGSFVITIVENIVRGTVVLRSFNRTQIPQSGRLDISALPEDQQRRLQHELEDLIKRGFLKEING